MIWGRVIGSVSGLFVGPFGVGLGFITGYMLDHLWIDSVRKRRVIGFLAGELDPKFENELPMLFVAAVGVAVSLAAEDGFVTDEQIGVIRGYTRDRTGQGLGAGEAEALVFRTVCDEAVTLGTRIDRKRICRALGARLEPDEAERFLEFLVTVAAADSRGLTERDRNMIEDCAGFLGIPIEKVRSISAAVTPPDLSDCEILGITADADESEIRGAYRRLAAQFHPDHATGLTELQQQSFHEAFLRIQNAYERVMGRFGGSDRTVG